MTTNPSSDQAKALLASYVLAIGTGVAIALAIDAAVKYGRRHAKSR